MKRRPPKPPSYLQDLIEAATRNCEKGKVYQANVAHDDWCDLLNNRGDCNCEPIITFVEIKEANENG